MTGSREIERIIANLEGASQVLNNISTSEDLTIETECGLKWLSFQIDSLMCELRNAWDATKPETGPKLEAVEK